MSHLKFGWAEEDLTPKRKISLAGEFFERVTDEVETPITVTALAIEDADGEQAIICSVDIVGISSELTREVRKRITDKSIQPEKIIISSVHIHNSYVYRRREFGAAATVSGFRDMLTRYMPDTCKYVPQVLSTDCIQPDEAFEIICNTIVKAAENAWKNRKAGGYAQGFGRAAVALNRRVCYSDGSAKMWGDADSACFTELESGTDSGIEMLFIYDDKKKLTGIVANASCPAQIMEQRSVISADYWGKVKILLREKYGKDIQLLGLCAPAGDLCPRDLIRWVEPETPIKDPNVIRNAPKLRKADPSMFDVKGTWKAGRRIFNEIEMALEEVTEGDIFTDAPLLHSFEMLPLPLRRVTIAERDAAERAMKEFFKDRTELDYNDSAALHVYAGTLIRYDLQEKFDTVDIELHGLRLGNVAFVTNPFELFLNYGNQIRARSDAEQTFMLQLTNGCLGYLPTEKAEKGGHYSAYISSGYVGHEGGDMLVRETLAVIRNLFAE